MRFSQDHNNQITFQQRVIREELSEDYTRVNEEYDSKIILREELLELYDFNQNGDKIGSTHLNKKGLYNR